MEIIKRSIIFIIIPVMTIFLWIIQDKFRTVNQVVTAILLILIYYAIGLALLKCISMSKGKNNHINSIRLVTLVLIDQFVKFCLQLFLHNSFVIVPSCIEIKIKHNVYHNSIMGLLEINNSRLFDCTIKTLFLVAIIMLFNYYKKRGNRKNRKFLLLATEFLIAGSISTILDTAIWGYTIDYIYFVGFMYIDFKDIIIDIGIILFIIFSKQVNDERKGK